MIFDGARESWEPPPGRRPGHRPRWLRIAEVVLTAVGVIVAGLVVGFGLAS